MNGKIASLMQWRRVFLRNALFGQISWMGSTLKRPELSRWAMRSWARSCCETMGVQLSLRGGAILESSPQCIIVANHNSFMDIVVLASFLKQDYRWLAKDLVFKVPFIGGHMRRCGHIPVTRGAGKALKIAENIHRVIEEGASVLFFPEGTRSEDGQLQSFHMGAFLSAVQEGLPVLPLIVRGTPQLLKKGSWEFVAPGEELSCSVSVLPLISPPQEGGDQKARARLLRDQVHQLFTEELERESA